LFERLAGAWKAPIKPRRDTFGERLQDQDRLAISLSYFQSGLNFLILFVRVDLKVTPNI